MKSFFALLSLFLTTTPLHAGSKSVANPIFSYTHMQPSPYTMPGGNIIFGSSVAIGITDFMEISTDVLRNFYMQYNAQVKFQLIDVSGFAAGLIGGWTYYTQGSQQIMIVSPGLTTAYGLSDSFAWILGGNVNFTNITVNYGGVTTSSLLRGTQVGSDLAWSYQSKKKTVQVMCSLQA
ncbi:MAG: hypothetical protein KA715_13065 [Xanthomonadaceae bacterium]|nr:hypothetical protein [Xanthomonadaceae bacterium]